MRTQSANHAHQILIERLQAAKPGTISNYPTMDEVLNARDNLEEFAKIVDDYLSQVFFHAAYEASVYVPKLGVSPLTNYMQDEDILGQFTRASLEFRRERV